MTRKEKGLVLYEKYSKRRDELGLTDYKVAQMAGISKSTLSDWKNGKCTPNAENRAKIAKAIRKNITYLFN